MQKETDAAGRHRVAKRNAELLLDIQSTKKEAALLRRNFVDDDAGLATQYDPAIAFLDEDDGSVAAIEDWDD